MSRCDMYKILFSMKPLAKCLSFRFLYMCRLKKIFPNFFLGGKNYHLCPIVKGAGDDGKCNPMYEI